MKYILIFLLLSCGEFLSSLNSKYQDNRSIAGGEDEVTFFVGNKQGTSKLYALNLKGKIQEVTDIPFNLEMSSFAYFNDSFYFSLYDIDGKNGELYKLSGSTLTLVKNINITGSSNPKHLTVYKDGLYFSATNGETGRELWRMYKNQNIVQVKDLQGGTKGSDPAQLIVSDGILYFSASTTIHGNELFYHDGKNTLVVEDNVLAGRDTFPRFLTVLGDELYFSGLTDGQGRSNYRSHLYKVKKNVLSKVDTTDLDIKFLKSYDGVLYGSCRDSSSGTELCDLQFNQLRVISDIFEGSSSSKPSYIEAFNNKLYFSAYTQNSGYELWSYDLTTRQKSLVRDLNNGIESSYPKSLHSFGDYLYFSATDGESGHELWRINKSGTVELARDVFPGKGSSYPNFAQGFYHL